MSSPPHKSLSLAARIRERSGGGQSLIDVLFEVLTDVNGAARDRLRAAEILLERGYGKAVETTVQIQATMDSNGALPDVSVDDLTRIARSLRFQENREFHELTAGEHKEDDVVDAIAVGLDEEDPT